MVDIFLEKRGVDFGTKNVQWQELREISYPS